MMHSEVITYLREWVGEFEQAQIDAGALSEEEVDPEQVVADFKDFIAEQVIELDE